MKKVLTILFILASLNVFSQNDMNRTDWGNLKKYAKENAALKPRLMNEKRIVFMGNSITELWNLLDSNFFEKNHYLNRGISGQTTPQMLVRFRSDVIDLKPSVVVILAGINDIAENTGPISLESIFGNIVSMAQLAKVNGITPVLCSVLPANVIPWNPQIKPADKVIRLNAMIQEYCKKNKLIYLDYYSKMANDQKGLDLKYTSDGVHPNLAGYKVMEPLAQEAIRKSFLR
ncbi:MAG: SGNH/GDSL hydrolase family protein [Bacteroidota bacterium]|nr:SGNH/GDSL hydrolase family protein [Bacteroidota bacterium]